MKHRRTQEEFVLPGIFLSEDRHKLAMRESLDTAELLADDGQVFSALHMNRDFTASGDRPLLVSLNAMFNSVLTEEQKYASFQLASFFENHPIVKLDLPAHGSSDRLSQAQLDEIHNGGGLSKVGEAQAQAIHRKFPDARKAVIIGESVGGRLSFEVAASLKQREVEPLAVIAFEPVGMEKRRSVDVAWSFFVTETELTSRNYRNRGPFRGENFIYEAVLDGFRNEIRSTGYKAPSANSISVKAFNKDRNYLKFLFKDSPLASDTGRLALEKLAEVSPGTYTRIVVGGLSTMCRWKNIGEWAMAFQEASFHQTEFDVWLDDSHGMTLAPQQPRVASSISRVLKSKRILEK